MPTDNTDNSLVSRYIRAIENPDSIGFRNGNWYQSNRKGDDPNNRGFGVDVKYNREAAILANSRRINILMRRKKEILEINI